MNEVGHIRFLLKPICWLFGHVLEIDVNENEEICLRCAEAHELPERYGPGYNSPPGDGVN